MAIEYKWTIDTLECFPNLMENIDVVSSVHWKIQAKEGEYSASIMGVQKLEYNPVKEFVPFEELTLEQVVDWLINSIGQEAVETIKNKLAREIEDQKVPSLEFKTAPWIEKSII